MSIPHMSTQPPAPSYSAQLLTSGASGGAAAVLPEVASSHVAHRLSWIDRLTLAAIGLVVVVVTLPVLRGFGLRENERDAQRMLRVIAAEPARGIDGRAAYASSAPGAQLSMADLVGLDRNVQRRLEDLELRSDGRVRRHGYLFDVATLRPGEPMLRAWPWEHAQTGRGAFVWTPQRGLLGHRNADGRFSGPDGAPQASDVLASGEWVTMSRH
jgi:hypothetical protein